jgi:hypothetical protein
MQTCRAWSQTLSRGSQKCKVAAAARTRCVSAAPQPTPLICTVRDPVNNLQREQLKQLDVLIGREIHNKEGFSVFLDRAWRSARRSRPQTPATRAGNF